VVELQAAADEFGLTFPIHFNT